MEAQLPRLRAAGIGPRHSGGAGMVVTSTGLRLIRATGGRQRYSNAQIDDFRGWPGGLAGAPPLRVSLRARFSHPAGALVGTAGFGLWNYPHALPPRLPRAVWFFYASPPSDMPLARGVPGRGWKAAAIDATSPRALALLPLAPVAVPLLRSRPGYRLLWPLIQRAAGVAEAPLAPAMDQWHTYEIEWGPRRSRLLVDGAPALEGAPSPRGPLCFIAWIDNQYLILTPQGRLSWGLLDAPDEQWLEIDGLRISRG